MLQCPLLSCGKDSQTGQKNGRDVEGLVNLLNNCRVFEMSIHHKAAPIQLMWTFIICLFVPQQLSTRSWIPLHLWNQNGWSCVYIFTCMTVWLWAVFVKCSSNMFQRVHEMWRDTEMRDSHPESSSSQALDICLTSYFLIFRHWLNSCGSILDERLIADLTKQRYRTAAQLTKQPTNQPNKQTEKFSTTVKQFALECQFLTFSVSCRSSFLLLHVFPTANLHCAWVKAQTWVWVWSAAHVVIFSFLPAAAASESGSQTWSEE